MTTIRDDDSSSPLGEARDALKRAEARIAALIEELAQERESRLAAEATLRGKDQFLSVLSHELRSPLNAILGWNRILTLKRGEDPEVSSATKRIEHSARMQLKMVNDLLDLIRLETGKLRIEARSMQLIQVAGAAVNAARPAAAAKGITLVENYEAGAGRVRGDPDRLQQVIANLLSNAVKFTSSGGHITVTVRDAGRSVELIVEDTGEGVTPELLPYIFDRLRPPAATPDHSAGLGLGLPLAREIVALHGGAVFARSAGSGGGATFEIRLPLRIDAEMGIAGADEDGSHTG
jgi:signal transduction histidine kinase